jgi:hypothetical protein
MAGSSSCHRLGFDFVFKSSPADHRQFGFMHENAIGRCRRPRGSRLAARTLIYRERGITRVVNIVNVVKGPWYRSTKSSGSEKQAVALGKERSCPRMRNETQEMRCR